MYADKAMSFYSTLKSLSVYSLLRGIKKTSIPQYHPHTCIGVLCALWLSLYVKKARNSSTLRADGVKILGIPRQFMWTKRTNYVLAKPVIPTQGQTMPKLPGGVLFKPDNQIEEENSQFV